MSEQRHLLNTVSVSKLINPVKNVQIFIQEYIDLNKTYIDVDPQGGSWLKVQPEYHVLTIVQDRVRSIEHMNLEQLLENCPWYLSERLVTQDQEATPIMGDTALLTNC